MMFSFMANSDSTCLWLCCRLTLIFLQANVVDLNDSHHNLFVVSVESLYSVDNVLFQIAAYLSVAQDNMASQHMGILKSLMVTGI